MPDGRGICKINVNTEVSLAAVRQLGVFLENEHTPHLSIVMGDTVELITSKGDRLNLKSKLSQYVSLTKMFKEAKIDSIELVAHEPEDVDKLFKFLLEG